MEILKDIRNELFKRNEIVCSLESEKNPGFEEVKKLIVSEIKKPEENIDVYNIKGNFGSKLFDLDAYIYDSKEDLENAIQKTQKQRKEEKKKSKAGAKKVLAKEEVEVKEAKPKKEKKVEKKEVKEEKK